MPPKIEKTEPADPAALLKELEELRAMKARLEEAKQEEKDAEEDQVEQTKKELAELRKFKAEQEKSETESLRRKLAVRKVPKEKLEGLSLDELRKFIDLLPATPTTAPQRSPLPAAPGIAEEEKPHWPRDEQEAKRAGLYPAPGYHQKRLLSSIPPPPAAADLEKPPE